MINDERSPQVPNQKQNPISRSQALPGWKTDVQTKSEVQAGDETGFFGAIVTNFTQILIRIISRILLPLLSKIEVRSEGFEDKDIKPLIFISNHKSYFDALVIAYSFPFFSKIFPLRFITWDRFFQGFFSRILFRSMGSYPAYYGQGIERSLQTPREILKNRGAVVFFIEGSCFRDDELHPAKPGAAILALRSPDAKILPFAIRGSYKIGRLFRRPQVQTTIGKPFYLKDKIDITTSTPEQVSELFMNEISNLYGDLR
ncbi:MAG: 1-acyl-sn-glycerol-3-phosphate acyltransferase [Candidatus Doudnabacteria bacterium]|nr:1-acyl-sn-glycerol-3-phosphate acyltransferase [Candidatus Doudnabacteria bacterium]